MTDPGRYRVEDGFHCVDVRIDTIENMFDNRDPAPFRARDLDPDLVEYLLAAAEDLASEPIRVVFWLGKPDQAKDDASSNAQRCGESIEPAFRAHMTYELERVDRRIRRQRAEGQLVLGIGVAVLAATIGTSTLLGDFPGSDVVKELLHLASWVVMWRPVDTLVYAWLPHHRQRTLMRRLCKAPVDVRTSSS